MCVSKCVCEGFAPVMRTQCAYTLECPRVPNLSTNGELENTEREQLIQSGDREAEDQKETDREQEKREGGR